MWEVSNLARHPFQTRLCGPPGIVTAAHASVFSALAPRLQPLHRRHLQPERCNCPLRLVVPGIGLHVREDGFERISQLPELPAIASHVVQNLLLRLGVSRLPEVELDEAKLTADCLSEPSSRVDSLADVT